MRLVHVLGTRPNFVKMAPVIAAARERFGPESSVVVHTGQHYDRAMSEVFFEELGVPEPDHMLGVGSGSHAEQTARVLERLEPVLRDERPDLVLVPGDVNSTLAAALCASRLGIAVGHVESGLRSFDRTMPEEINRVVADHLSELLFLHSAEAEENLRAEGVPEEPMKFVGNTMIDTLVALEQRFRAREAARSIGVEPGLIPARHPASPGTCRRAAARRGGRGAGAGCRADAGGVPRSPADQEDARRRRCQRGDAHRSGRLPRLPLARGRRRRRAHGFRRDPGGDHLPRDPLLHPARQHRAPGHRARRHQHAPRAWRPAGSPRSQRF